ncbi:MAG: NAD(P)/FAD-dependent oxidoreductase [Bacteroidota bacterium]
MAKENIIIIGGGAAGFFSAIHLAFARPKANITILERGKAVLEKVRVSGGGRCNVTHACWDPRELVKFYPRGSRELLGPFNRFACGDTMGWFEDRGVELKIEDDGRVFPVTDNSSTIIDCLWGTAKRKGVKVITRCRVDGVTYKSDGPFGSWLVTANGEKLVADRAVVTTGSNPRVWDWLGKLGLTTISPVPSLFAFNIPDKRLHALSGISLPWSQVSIEGEPLKAEGPLLITHKGLSGPAILRLSAWGARQLAPKKYHFTLRINWLARREQDVLADLIATSKSIPRQRVGSRGQFDLPQRLWRYLITKAGVTPEMQWAQISKKQVQAIAESLVNCSYQVNGKATNKEEFVTAGGVDLKEVDFKTFSAKQYPTLHLAGEVLDIDAITGGFNFQAAWTGGYLIGLGAEE